MESLMAELKQIPVKMMETSERVKSWIAQYEAIARLDHTDPELDAIRLKYLTDCEQQLDLVHAVCVIRKKVMAEMKK
jgi:glycine betaine/choline ABC-type transport system substrate-binding protein